MKTPVTALLSTLAQQGIADEPQCQHLADEASNVPWLAALQAVAAWFAALFAAFFALGLSGGNGNIFGIVFIGAALWLFWMQRSSPFANHMALGLSLAGQLLLLYGGRFLEGRATLLQGAVVAALLALWPQTSYLHRIVCMVLALWLGCYQMLTKPYPGIMLWLLMTLASALWLTRRQWSVWPRASYFGALAHAASFLALALLLWLHSQSFSLVRFILPTLQRGLAYWGYSGGAALLWLACVLWLTRSLAVPQRLYLLGAAVLLTVIGMQATPSLLLCLTLMLATFHACQRAWFALALLATWAVLGVFYYSLHQTLLLKSLSLGAAGLALLLLGWQVRRWRLQDTDTP